MSVFALLISILYLSGGWGHPTELQTQRSAVPGRGAQRSFGLILPMVALMQRAAEQAAALLWSHVPSPIV